MLGKLVANCRANFLVRLAVMTVSSGKSLDVRNSLKVPNEDVREMSGALGSTAIEQMISFCGRKINFDTA
jgi:hypothetical protein